MEEKEKVSVPEIEGSVFNWYWVCSNCHGHIIWHEEKCPYCKRRIDWNGENI